MKRTVKGISLDTSKALIVCDIWESMSKDPDHLDCILYLAQEAGQFFLAGLGGSQTPLAGSSTDVSGYRKDRITPIGTAEARAYAELYADPMAFEKFFGESPQDRHNPVL